MLALISQNQATATCQRRAFLHARALELARKDPDLSVRAIAERIGASPNAVAQWLKAAKGGR